MLRVNTSKCRGELRLLKLIFQKRGWKEVFDLNSDIFWSAFSLNSDEYVSLKLKKIKNNRIPCLADLAEKRLTAFFLNKFQFYFPENFDFYPKTFLLPEDYQLLKSFKKQKGNKSKLLIVKPTSGSQGDGILLMKTLRDFENFFNINYNNMEYVAQEYLNNPLLIDKKKFDIRLYVLISSVSPLKFWIHDQGLARFCTEDYEKPTLANLKNIYMHLSNYSLNKNSKNYIYSEECKDATNATKRSLESLWKNFEQMGISDKKQIILDQIYDLVKKFMISMYPFICYYCKLNYGTSQSLEELGNFHVLGFDIMIDENFKPWLLEINANPSLNIEHDPNYVKLVEVSPVDYYVKEKVVEDCLDLLNLKKEALDQIQEGDSFKGYKLLMNGSPDNSEMGEMNIFIKILQAFSKLSGDLKFNGYLNSRKFLKLHELNSKGIFKEKLERYDFDLIFTNLTKFGTGMSFYRFIFAIELLSDKFFGIKLPDKKVNKTNNIKSIKKAGKDNNNNEEEEDSDEEQFDSKEKLERLNILVDAILAD